MQALQPQLKALQEKYKNDRQVLNQKVMEFYQENNVSPFGSCLPLLLQMPVFLGLFYMLREQGQAGGAFFDPNPVVSWLWIADITKFDFILMFLYIASQFLASWQTARKGASQQKMIAYLMPVMVGIFMFIGRWPAGLFIYWVTSNLWTIAQQFVAERLLPIHVSVSPSKDKATSMQTAGKVVAKTGDKRGKAPAGSPPEAGGKNPAKRPAVSAGKAPAKTGSKVSAKSPARKSGKVPAKTGGGESAAVSAAKSGGKSSGQKTGQDRKTAGGKSQRPDGGSSGPESSGGA